MQPTTPSPRNSLTRIRIWYALLLLACGLVVVRLFYLQVIRHDYYQKAALSGQLKEYEIPSQRGIIEVQDGDNVVPIVLNEIKYTLFADPKFIEDPEATAKAVAKAIGGEAVDYKGQMKTDSRYAVLAKKLTKEQKEAIDKLAEDDEDLWKGVGTREVPYRTYPQGSLAAQLLGFVNDDGEGKYGLEEALDDDLKGTPGQLKAITDSRGVPLAANRDNTLLEPKPGDRLVLTIDIGMQQQLEDILKKSLDRARSASGSAVIMEAHSGAIKAMANYPTYNPAEFFNVKSEDAGVFTNPAVDSPLEPGSIMKPLTVAAAIDYGVINKDSSYNDPGKYVIDGVTVDNVESGGGGTRTIADILQLSLNTGATWMLMQMGGGQVNSQARTRWYDYMSDRYRFGKAVGVEQGYEASGTVPDPNEGFGLNIRFANTAFGQGMSTTLLQLAGAYSAVLNGGTYFQPHLVDRTIGADGVTTKTPLTVVRENVVKPDTSTSVRQLMEYVMERNHANYGLRVLRPEYSIGGKTGTAQYVQPGGGYYADRFHGTFAGFVGGNEAQYVIIVRVNDPRIGGYAGAKAAGPLFSDLAVMLIDNFGVTPKQ